jgi:hypothetical protein
VDIVGYTRRSLTIVCIFFLLSSMAISSVSGATKHGCAPGTPPPVAGTLADPEATAQVVFLNEVLSNPGSTWNCSDTGAKSAQNETWVELYNPQKQALDLYAVHSSLDSGPNTTPFYLPVGAAIASQGFLVVFPPVAIFAQLSSSAGSSLLRLLINGTVVDQVTLFPLVSDTSYARIPDGGDSWQVTDAPTIDASNVPPTPTPEATRTSQSSSSKTAGNKSSAQQSTRTLDTGAISDTGNQLIGTQPAWNALLVPAATHYVPETTPSTISHPAPQVNNAADLPRKILLTSLAVASLIGLLWCSRFFTRAKQLSGNPVEESPTQQNGEFSQATAHIPNLPNSHPLIDRSNIK